MLHYLNHITNYLLTQSWQIALIVLVLAALSLALKNKSAHVKYLLWLIVLAKCLVPPLVTIPFAILPQERLANTVMLLPAERSMVANDILNTAPAEHPISFPTQVPTERTARLTVRQWLGLGWIIGATMFVLIAVIKAFRTNVWIRQKRRQLPAQMRAKIEELFSNLNIRNFPKIWLIEGIGQPFVWGLLSGSIYLPADFIKVHNTEHRRGILGHELSHVLRFDAAVNFLQVVAQAIFWFHPFVWWANKKIRAEREKCCDEMAIARLGTEAKEYSTAIVNILVSEYESTHPVPSLAIAGPVKNIEERIRTMLRPGKKFYKRPSLIAVMVVLLLALLTVPTVLVLTARAGTNAEETGHSADGSPERDADILELSESKNKVICTGKVLNNQGKPITGAKVTAYEMYSDGIAGNILLRQVGEVTTAKDGAFIFATTPKPERGVFFDCCIVAVKQDLALGWAVWSMREDMESNIRLGRPTKLEGVIVDEAGKPVFGAEVRANLYRTVESTEGEENREWLPGIPPLGELATQTNEQGKFLFSNLPADLGVDLLVMAEGKATLFTYQSEKSEPAFKTSQSDIRVILPNEARIEGQIVDPDTGQGIAGVKFAVVFTGSGVFYYRFVCTTDDNGAFSIGGLQNSEYLIRGRSRNSLQPTYVNAKSGQTKKVTVGANKLYYGRILFEDGSPAVIKPEPWPGAKTRINVAGKGEIRNIIVDNLNDEGHFEIYLSQEQYQQLQLGKAWFEVKIPYTDKRTYMEEDVFAYDLLATDRDKAGVAKLARPESNPDSQSKTTENTNLQVIDVKFEPIHQGKNVVHVQVKNNSDKEQTFGIHIQTRSPDYGQHGVGWGRPFFDQIGPRETNRIRCAFQIQGPITDSTWIRLQFYNPISAKDYDFDKWFKKNMYYGKDLKKLEISDQSAVPASQKDSEAVTWAFLQIQTFIRDKRYEQAWQMFTEDYKNAAQVNTLEKFVKHMEEPAYARFYWEKEQFTELKPKDVTAKDGVLSLKAIYKEQAWTIDFVREDSQWKIDWVGGYTPAVIRNQLAEQQQDSQSAENVNLEILDVKFEPIRQGKNVVRVKVQNTSAEEQIFRLQIYTRSPDYGRDGVGWGTSFFDSIKPKETKWTRFVFKIQGPITNSTYARLDFHNPGPAASFDIEKWINKTERKPYFKRVKYLSSDLERYEPDKAQVKQVSKRQTDAVIQAFRKIQGSIRDKKYEQVWKLFTNDYQDAEFQFRANAFERFKKTMEPTRPIDSAFWWEKDDFLNLQPQNVVEQNGVFTLIATSQNQTWTIDFIHENGQWKIDWIAGYTPRVLQWQNWEERLLPKMEKRSTKHFDIYYFKGSTAEREIEQIAEDKERGFRQICQFLGKDSDARIRIVFFEDRQTKQRATGHQGMGWATGNTIVEIYNEKEKLDPYHETTHILMGPYGNPPALFNEGFAVYMSEKLGAQALKNLGGGEATIYQRVKELKKNNEWIELEELLTYTEIGSLKSRPPISYAESASFVKFLIEIYGKNQFLQTYKTLKNSDEKSVQQQNTKSLEQIFGQPLKHLEQKWIETFSKD